MKRRGHGDAEGGQSERHFTLNIWKIGRGRARFAATVSAAVTTIPENGLLRCALDLRKNEGLSTFFTRRGDSRKLVML